MYDKVNDHEERIIILEKSDIEIVKRIERVENNYVNLENTILKGNQQQQEFFRDTMQKQWELITARDQSKESEREREHERLLGKQGIVKGNWDSAWKVFGQAVTAGGIIYVVIEYVLLK